ncbi:hypothetical protein [Brevundimonas sp.]|jgi:hypothetical protein|uniref:hypothetical protein n=1 Tax=Brevundimonas sp. TaxID=1871086 RepID=UPI0028A957E1|nr:hypothetical protein [Brevundimonas sp.]
MADNLNDYLESLNAAAFTREFEQEEHIMKSLPFFAAVLGIAVTILAKIFEQLPRPTLNLWAVVTWFLLAASLVAFARIVWSLLQIVRKRGTLLPSDEIKMLEWSNDLVAFHKAASLTDAAARRAAQRDVQLRMIEEYARCAVHNRRQNAVKISERSAGFTWLAGLMVLSIGTAASLALWKALY